MHSHREFKLKLSTLRGLTFRLRIISFSSVSSCFMRSCREANVVFVRNTINASLGSTVIVIVLLALNITKTQI